jgi:hypothetical protein
MDIHTRFKKDNGTMDTKSINTISPPAAGITIIRTHPQKNITIAGITITRIHPQKSITTVGITITRTHPQKNIITVGITITRTHPQKDMTAAGSLNLRNHPTKNSTKGLVIIKSMLKTEKNRNKIPGTPTVTEQSEEMRNVSHKKTKPGNPAGPGKDTCFTGPCLFIMSFSYQGERIIRYPVSKFRHDI